MLCGLTNLATLRSHLLPATNLGDPTWDNRLALVGQMVAGAFAGFLNRELLYSAAQQHVFSGSRYVACLARLPIIAVASVELRILGDASWQTLENEPAHFGADNGLVHFTGVLGGTQDLVRVTYSGGYSVESLEPDEEGYPSNLPSGSAWLPDVFKSAFLQQCKAVWEAQNNLGDGLAQKAAAPLAVDLLPHVKTALQPHVRYSIT
jgi:hypothetical protein